MAHPPNARVAMLARELNSYRVGFFDAAREQLAHDGIEFRLLLGGATAADKAKSDEAHLEWAERFPATEFSLAGRELWRQPVMAISRQSDLVITEQAAKQLANIPLSLLQRLGFARHCLWGHGQNFQASIEGTSGEGLKHWFTKSAHWFFSYTDLSTEVLRESGFPPNRITTFNNSTDVTEIRMLKAGLPTESAQSVRDELHLGSGPILGYLGGIYPPKRTEFLLDSLDEIHDRMPDVNVLVIGSGTEEYLVRDAAAGRPWLHPLGAIYGPERVRYGSACSALLMPGLVGLNLVDGFALGLPTFTTGIDYHSPEIAYLRHGVNGWVSPGSASPAEYAGDVARLLADGKQLKQLQAGAWEAGSALGIESMAERFARGVRAALDAPCRPRQIT